MFSVAIIGRPNVGKSTLFNRLAGRKLALVDDTPGVTRDRREHDARLYDLRFRIMDTAGLEKAVRGTLAARMSEQTLQAARDADVILFMIDARAGVTPADAEFAEVARKSGKPVIVVANKSESKKSDAGFLESWSLGLGEPVPVSAEHGMGLPDLRDAIVAAVGEERVKSDDAKDAGEAVAAGSLALPGDDIDDPDSEAVAAYDETRPLHIAVAGRPNAGKSTLINTMLKEERLLTGPEAGITRDSISVDWSWRGRPVKLFDTAGLRRKARVQEKLEKLSVADALRAVRFAEVVVIVLDATIPFEKQDLQIVDLVVREGRAPVIAFNKWDLVEDRQALLAELREKTGRLLPQIRGIRAVPISGETGEGLDRLMQAVVDTHKIWNRRVPTARLNRWLEQATAQHPPPAVSGRRLKVKYITQVKTRPPGFVLNTSRPEAMPQSYVRYLINGLRDTFDMPGVPIRIVLKASDNPYAGRTRQA